MYNVAKVSRRGFLPFFPVTFDALCKLSADADADVQNAAHLLDRLVKDIVAESGSFDVRAFAPMLRERITILNPTFDSSSWGGSPRWTRRRTSTCSPVCRTCSTGCCTCSATPTARFGSRRTRRWVIFGGDSAGGEEAAAIRSRTIDFGAGGADAKRG